MNNFKLALGQSWNKYYAINELLGSFLLIFFAIIFFHLSKKHIKNKYIVAPIIGITFLASTMITIVMGHLYGGSSNAIAFINPISVIANGVMRNMYIGMPYLITFEFLGSLLGGALALLILKGLGQNLKEFAQELPFDNSKIIIAFTKETILNTFLTLSIIAMPLFSWINSTLDSTMTLVILSFVVTILLLVSIKNGYFMFMLPFSIVLLIIKLIFGKPTKQELINLSIAGIVNIATAFIIGAIFYVLINNGKIYYSLV